ncbi:MAG TPA: oligosaccharide flippase family protein [Chitinophagaceae bacterium]|nr:oligosaccharide flippase family protein [Chitinophagaceae bacterium]
MSSIKNLASQTFWYGFSNIFGRFLNYLLTPLLTTIFASQKYGDISILFASAAFLNVIYTYGMETSYFRFSNVHPEKEVYNTGLSTMVITTVVFTAILFIPVQSLANYMEIGTHPEYVQWVLLIVALDTLAVMPFSRLRHEGRPRKFAAIKVLNILINIGLVIFFLVFCKGQHEKGAENVFALIYNPSIDIGYVFIAQLVASGITLLLLWKEFTSFSFVWNGKLIREMLIYTAPLVIVGFGGMINETIDRFMITSMYPGTSEEARSANGIYSANAKLAIIITLFITAFRMGAEPFFFKQAKEENAQRTYARVMKFFVIACCLCFLSVMLFLDIWKYFMGVKKHPEYLEGLKIVPLLMLDKIFLGIYYNLSIWYKLTNKNLMAAYLTVAGAILTIGINWILIPRIGYIGCAIASFVCYGFMMTTSYVLGQKYYPVPYAWKKLLAYIVICLILFLIHQLFRAYSPNIWLTHGFGVLLVFAFMYFVSRVEEKEFAKIRSALSR